MRVLVWRRRSASEQPKATPDPEADAGMADDANVDVVGELLSFGNQSSPAPQLLRPVMSSDREALEAELDVLRRQLSSTAVGAG